MPFSFQRPKFSKLTQWLRWAYNFDGIDDRGQLQFRAINPDGDNTFEFWSPENFSLFRTIVSQSINSAISLREFGIFCGNTGLGVNFGGVETIIMSLPQGFKASTRYGLTLIGTTAQVFEGGLGGSLVRTATFTRGTAREPAAVTLIGVRANNAGAFANCFAGLQYDVKINGTLWPMADRNQPIQLPSPSELGAETFNFASAQQTGAVTKYGDHFHFDVTGGAVATVQQPPSSIPAYSVYLLELEVFDYVTGSLATSAAVFQQLNVTGNGVYRSIFSNDLYTRLLLSRVGSVCNLKVRNISLKPLWTASTTELVANGDFSGGTSGWSNLATSSFTVSSGQASIGYAAGQNSRIERGVTLQANKYYLVSADSVSLSGVTGGRLMLIRGAAGNYVTVGQADFSAAGKVSFVILAPASDSVISLRTNDSINSGTIVWDNVSIREITNLCNPLTLVNTTSDRWQEVQ